MLNLKFKHLYIKSNARRSANHFMFSEKLNLITANDNSAGKTTLMKMLLWAMGCEPFFDSRWKSEQVQTLLEFSIKDNNYEIIRNEEFIWFRKVNETFSMFTKITGEFSELMSSILNFRVDLIDRNSETTSVPPPAYYFTAFYIDQRRSWKKPWDNFDKLSQYEQWRNDIIKYHIGLLTPEYFRIIKLRQEKKGEKADKKEEINELTSTKKVINRYYPPIDIKLGIKDLQEKSNEIKNDLKTLSEQQEELYSCISRNTEEKAFLCSQIDMLEKHIEELSKDYIFSVEKMEEGPVRCPLCGNEYCNDILARTSILADKNELERQLQDCKESLDKVCEKIEKDKIKLDKIKNNISKLQGKYSIIDKDNTIDLADIIERTASERFNQKMTLTIDNHEQEIKIIDKDIKDYNKAIKKIVTEDDEKKSYANFWRIYSNIARKLEVSSLLTILSPLEYTKVENEGGAADGSRSLFAYYLAIYAMICKYSNEVVAPFIIDSPYQQDQSIENYNKIISVILQDMPETSQIFLCATKHEQLSDLVKQAKVIELKKGNLLIEEQYSHVWMRFKQAEDVLFKQND